MTWMVDSFLHFDVELGAADSLADHLARLTPVGIGSSAWARLLGITAIAFDQPRRRFQKPEVGVGHRWHHSSQHSREHREDEEGSSGFHRCPFKTGDGGKVHRNRLRVKADLVNLW